MKVCGIELKGNEAIICVLSLEQGLFSIPLCRMSRINLDAPNDPQQLRYFQFTFEKLVDDYKIDKLVIRQRPTKGKFAGGYVGFKAEAVLQLSTKLDVVLMSIPEFKESLKNNELTIDFKATGLKKFQESAFNTAFAYLSLLD